MSIYKRVDSRFWWLTLERPGQPPLRESTKIPVHGGTVEQTKDNRALAQQAYAARLGDLARARHHLPIDRPTITFAKFRAWYEAHVSTQKRNLARERSMLRQLGPFFDSKALDALTREDVLEWRTARAKQVAPGTVNRELALLCHLLGQAVPKYLDRNPAARISEVRSPARQMRLVTEEEEDRLLAAGSDEDRALVLTALDTLQRLSAVANLTWAQDHGHSLEFLNLKTRGRLVVPISSRLRIALDQLPKDGPWIFPWFHWGKDTREQIQQRVDERFRGLCGLAKIPHGRAVGGVTFHTLRHTGASRMLARGIDPRTVMVIGGWSSLKMLEQYTHPQPEHARRAVEAVGKREGDVKENRQASPVSVRSRSGGIRRKGRPLSENRRNRPRTRARAKG